MKGKYEIAVGILFIIAMLILGYYTIIMSSDMLRRAESYGMSMLFPTAEGLDVTSKVRVNGVISGSIESIDLYKNQVKVSVRMFKQFTLYENYIIAIKTESLLGGKVVSIFPGTPFDKSGNAVEVVSDFTDLTGRTDDPFGSITMILDENREDIRATISNIRQITEKINTGQGTLGKLINEDKFHTDTSKLVKELREAIEDSREQAPVTSFIRAALTAF